MYNKIMVIKIQCNKNIHKPNYNLAQFIKANNLVVQCFFKPDCMS